MHPSQLTIPLHPAGEDTEPLADAKNEVKTAPNEQRNGWSKIDILCAAISSLSLFSLALYYAPSQACAEASSCAEAPLNIFGKGVPWWVFMMCGGIDFVLMGVFFAFDAIPKMQQYMGTFTTPLEKWINGLQLISFVLSQSTLSFILSYGANNTIFAIFCTVIGDIATRLYATINLFQKEFPYWSSKIAHGLKRDKSAEEIHDAQEYRLFKQRIAAGMAYLSRYPHRLQLIVKVDDPLAYIINIADQQDLELKDERTLVTLVRAIFILAGIANGLSCVIPIILTAIHVISMLEILNTITFYLALVMPVANYLMQKLVSSEPTSFLSAYLPLSMIAILSQNELANYFAPVLLTPVLAISLTYTLLKISIEGFNSLFDGIKDLFNKCRFGEAVEWQTFQFAPGLTIALTVCFALTASLSYATLWALYETHYHLPYKETFAILPLIGVSLFHYFGLNHCYNLMFSKVTKDPEKKYLFNAKHAGEQALWMPFEKFVAMKSDSAKVQAYGIRLFGQKYSVGSGSARSNGLESAVALAERPGAISPHWAL